MGHISGGPSQSLPIDQVSSSINDVISADMVFSLDWTKDSDFIDSNEDVTARVLSANWQVGITRPYIDTADDSAAIFIPS